jgi:hypothetical protein
MCELKQHFKWYFKDRFFLSGFDGGDLHYCPGDEIEKNEMDVAYSAYGEGRGVYRVFVGKTEGKRPQGRPMCRWKDNININLQDVRCGGMEWI